MNHQRANRFANVVVAIVVATTASTHFSVNTVVSSPCTINPSASSGSGSPVSCAGTQNQSAPPSVTYDMSADGGMMIMLIEF